MLLDKNLIKKTHYDILGVPENASHAEIRSSYRSAILDYHPDKLKNTSEPSSTLRDLEDMFIEVHRAWEVLSSSKSRFAYDCELQAMRQEFVAAEDVCVEDLTVETIDEVFEFSYQCRCGDHYSIDSSELEEIGYKLLRDGTKVSVHTPDDSLSSVLLPCGSCSLQIRVFINRESKLETNDQ